jgi:steroid 5-alpha reductase family enzyme
MSGMVVALLISLLMLSVWAISVLLRDVSIVDITWGLGFVLIAWVVFFFRATTEQTSPNILLPILVSLWGLRLSGHLFLRNHGKPEDFRYRQMRDYWGKSFWWISLFTVFILQGIVMWLVSLPLHIGDGKSTSISVTLLGVTIWSVGLFFESVGDWQLTRFRSDPAKRGQVLDTGLWRYTRHPNYFGDFLVWWGLYFTALGASTPWWTIVSPLLMTVLLLQISGVSLLEKSLKSSKPQYGDYASRTSSFFPMPPKDSRDRR